MTESVLNFGPTSCLVGILTEPSEQRDPDLAVVLLNSGIIHRAGPNRIYVRLARKLAAAGVLSFRIDMAGIGDSSGLGTSESVDEECLMSVKAALDFLEERGSARRFVVFGLCSGAQYAFMYALRDRRVVGIVGIDPPTLFRSGKFYLVRALGIMKRPVVWYRFLTGRYKVTGHLLSRIRAREDPEGTTPSGRGTRHGVRTGFTRLVERGVGFLLIITSTEKERYNYEGQLFDLFPGIGLETIAKVGLHPEADHTFSREVDRRALEREVGRWLEQVRSEQPAASPVRTPAA